MTSPAIPTVDLADLDGDSAAKERALAALREGFGVYGVWGSST